MPRRIHLICISSFQGTFHPISLESYCMTAGCRICLKINFKSLLWAQVKAGSYFSSVCLPFLVGGVFCVFYLQISRLRFHFANLSKRVSWSIDRTLRLLLLYILMPSRSYGLVFVMGSLFDKLRIYIEKMNQSETEGSKIGTKSPGNDN